MYSYSKWAYRYVATVRTTSRSTSLATVYAHDFHTAVHNPAYKHMYEYGSAESHLGVLSGVWV